MEKRCFHPANFKITWVTQVQTDFVVENGQVKAPESRDQCHKPHVKFECGDCGFTAYYSAHRAPHWFRSKLEAAGTSFPGEICCPEGETQSAVA